MNLPKQFLDGRGDDGKTEQLSAHSVIDRVKVVLKTVVGD